MSEIEGVVPGGPSVDSSGQATGERFVPELMGGGLLEAEHQARYRFAAQVAPGRSVFDAGCGVGWGLEILLRQQAVHGAGMDLSADAVADARRRVPEATVIQGDLRELGPELGTYGLVTCFEVLEHIDDYQLVLDRLIAVTAPDGILMVSSPNPGVYPAGNPFHVHELSPAELAREVADRLPHVALWRQRGLVGSFLRDAAAVAEWPRPVGAVTTFGLPGIYDGRDQYSVAVASRVPLPTMREIAVLSTSDQLDDLARLAETLEKDRRDLWADHERIVAERDRWLGEAASLRETSAASGRDAAEAREALAEARVQAAELLDEVAYLREELDRISLLLLDSEQEAARSVLCSLGKPMTSSDRSR